MDRFRKSFSDCFSLIVTALVILCFIIMKDTGTTAALCWLAVVFSVSFFMRPFMPFSNLKFSDNAFGLRYSFGIFICFFTAWNISATGVCEYSDMIVYLTFVAFAFLGIFVRIKVQKEPYVTKDEVLSHFKGFAVFAVIFLVFFWVIGFNPVVDPGTENYMDFGFMQTIYRQKSAVPYDMWFSGTKLNYYYLGQSLAVYMCRLARTTPEYGYNMMLATFIALVFVMAAELASSIAGALLPESTYRDRCVSSGGIIGAFCAAFCANCHWLLYGVLLPLFGIHIGGDNGRYWFSDPTVWIGTAYGDPDNGKNEFPAYSVLLGDLHAHVINVIFVLPLVALLFDMCLMKKEAEDDKRGRLSALYKLVMISTLLGYYKGSNYWDFAIYYVITGAVIVFTDINKRGFTLTALLHILVKAVVVTGVSLLVIRQFMRYFVKMESGIEICTAHSPLMKLAVLWFIPVAVTASLIAYLYSKKGSADVADNTARAGFAAFALCTIGLVITPEVIYVKDIYGASNKRFNTMFKLTYQAFVLFAVIIGIAFAVLMYSYLKEAKRSKIKLSLIAASVAIVALSAGYMPCSIWQWYGNVFSIDMRRGISSFSGLSDDETYGFEMRAHDFLVEDDRNVINIVEAAGDSYTHDNALSVYSGACAPIGWFVHEWMWHNDSEQVRERADRVSYFYTGGNEEYCRNFIKLYDIDYIFVGPVEVCRYAVNTDGFAGLGEVCISTEWSGCELSLIKVDSSKL